MPELRPISEIAAEIRRLRGGLTLSAFAEKAGKPGQGPQFGKYEAGRVPPSLETLDAIAAAAGVPVTIFYRAEGLRERPLSTSDVAQLRDHVNAARDQLDEALVVLEGALGRIEHGDERRPPLVSETPLGTRETRKKKGRTP